MWHVLHAAPNCEPQVCKFLGVHGIDGYAPQFPPAPRTKPPAPRVEAPEPRMEPPAPPRANALLLDRKRVGIYVKQACERGIPVKTFTVPMPDVDCAVADGEEVRRFRGCRRL